MRPQTPTDPNPDTLEVRPKSIWTPIRYWAGKGSATIIDQGCVSGSNFLLGVVLARTLGPERYGIYVLVFSIFLLAVQLHQALVLDLMGALQPAFFPNQRRGYVRSLVSIHWLIAATLVGIVGIALWFVFPWKREYGLALCGLIPAIPLILLFWLYRTANYLSAEPEKSARASVLYCLTMAAGLALSIWNGIISPFAAFCIMSAASVVAAIYLRLTMTERDPEGPPSVAAVWQHHWSLGRWFIGVQAIGWFQSTCIVFLTSSMLSATHTGVLTAMVSMMLPVQHILMAATRLLLPHAAKMLANQGVEDFRSFITRMAWLSTAGGVAYWLLITAFDDTIVRVLFGEKYMSYYHLVPWFMISIALSTATFPYDLATRAMRLPRLQLYVNCTSAVFTLLVGLYAVPRWGLPGVVATNVAKDIVIFALMRFAYWWGGKLMVLELANNDVQPDFAR